MVHFECSMCVPINPNIWQNQPKSLNLNDDDDDDVDDGDDDNDDDDSVDE